jgi:DNA-binding NtrC family response regulator
MALGILADSRYESAVPVPRLVPVVGCVTRPLDPATVPFGRLALKLPDGGELRLDRAVTLGAAGANDVVLRDGLVSRQHCVIEPAARGVVVRDLGSTNGTWLNGVRVAAAELRPGALLALGGLRLRVVAAGVDGSPLVGRSPEMRELKRAIERLASCALPVLVCGETGTGKELVAAALHAQSGRAGAFVPINCGALPRDLIESELFGHERGAFTGAHAPRSGVFREADGGTLFLDEVGELPAPLQTRLLRALETGCVRPVGAARELTVEVRVVAATHVDLAAAVRAGRFREDLYYRLAGAVLRTPALRERPSDVPELARTILAEVDGGCRLTDAAIAALMGHAWPGNVRELKNVLRRAAVLAGPEVDADDLGLTAPLAPDDDDDEGSRVRIDGRKFTDIEREVLEHALRRHGGNRRAAAAALGIPKSTLCDKARRYGLIAP